MIKNSCCVTINMSRKGQGVAIYGRRLAHLPKGSEPMPITLTFHVLFWTVTIRVKSRNRHSAK